MQTLRIPLKPGVTIDDLDRLAWTADWALQNVIQASDENPYEAVWLDDAGNEIHFLDDPMVGIAYVVVLGDGAAGVEATLRAKLRAMSDDEIAALARDARTAHERVEAVLYAGLAAGGASALVDVISDALASDDVGVRGAAVLAAGYAERRELRESLVRLRDGDPDPGVREDADAVLDGLERVWSGPTS